MALFWIFSVCLLILTAGLATGYAIAKRNLGYEAAKRGLRHGMFGIFIGILLYILILATLGLAFTFISPKFRMMTDFHVLGSLIFIAFLPFYFSQRRQSGQTLLDAGRNIQIRIIFRVGLFQIFHATFQTFLFISDIIEHSYDNYWGADQTVMTLVFLWVMAGWLILLGLTKLEFREKGIYFMLGAISWERMESYYWEQSKSSTLTIRLRKGKMPFAQRFASLAIPARYRAAVDQIMREQLTSKDM